MPARPLVLAMSATSSVAGRWKRLAKVAWFAVPPLVFMKDRWVWVYCVDGRSMSPTLNPQESFIDRCFRDVVLVFRNAEFQKGDVVVLRDPNSNNRIVKRLVSQGNEFIRKDEGGFTYVPPGHAWVEGDNPPMSVDSRKFNAVPMGLLDALVVAVVWPIWRARWLDFVDLPEEPTLQQMAALTVTGDDVGASHEARTIGSVPVEAPAAANGAKALRVGAESLLAADCDGEESLLANASSRSSPLGSLLGPHAEKPVVHNSE